MNSYSTENPKMHSKMVTNIYPSSNSGYKRGDDMPIYLLDHHKISRPGGSQNWDILQCTKGLTKQM